jgi:DNA-binding YbaB/EbfC family protein
MMKGNIAGLMKQAQQMQENMKRAQAELASMEVTGQAGNGLIQVTVSGKYELKRVQIAEGAMEDREMLEDLMVVAYADAFKQVEAASEKLMSALLLVCRCPLALSYRFNGSKRCSAGCVAALS